MHEARQVDDGRKKRGSHEAQREMRGKRVTDKPPSQHTAPGCRGRKGDYPTIRARLCDHCRKFASGEAESPTMAKSSPAGPTASRSRALAL